MELNIKAVIDLSGLWPRKPILVIGALLCNKSTKQLKDRSHAEMLLGFPVWKGGSVFWK